MHTPATHDASVPHVFPQSPQLSLSLSKFAQYGVPESPPQTVWLIVHAPLHIPATHVSFGMHCVPHLPQFLLSFFVSAQYAWPPPSGTHIATP
jgi:hypothetical protein